MDSIYAIGNRRANMMHKAMNQHEVLSLNVKLGIKAIQNLTGSQKAFERMELLFETKEDIGLLSLFFFGVIKYAKIFLESSTAFAKKEHTQ